MRELKFPNLMKKNLFVLFLIIIMGACSTPMPDIDNTLPVVKPTETPVTLETNNPAVPPTSVNNLALNPPHGEPGHDCNIAVGAALNGASNSLNSPLPIMPGSNKPLDNSSTKGVRLNPPHGEPGHDCNIQVGQPLS